MEINVKPFRLFIVEVPLFWLLSLLKGFFPRLSLLGEYTRAYQAYLLTTPLRYSTWLDVRAAQIFCRLKSDYGETGKKNMRMQYCKANILLRIVPVVRVGRFSWNRKRDVEKIRRTMKVHVHSKLKTYKTDSIKIPRRRRAVLYARRTFHSGMCSFLGKRVYSCIRLHTMSAYRYSSTPFI